jgi:capsid protein
MIQSGQEIWLPNGWGYDSHTPNHPNRGWVDFSIGLQRMISIGLGVDFTELTGNASAGISVSVRQAILRTREMYKSRQLSVSSLVLDRLYHAWLRSFLSLDISGALGLSDFDRLSDHEFTGRRWGWVDPSAEMNAATTAVAHGWRSDADVAADYGNDINDNIQEAARIKDAKASAGLVTVGNALNAAQPVTSAGDDGGGKPEEGD